MVASPAVVPVEEVEKAGRDIGFFQVETKLIKILDKLSKNEYNIFGINI